MNVQKRPNGFTIIEVLIVLVIVTFILLLVFIVVPRAQQQTRNHQRKNAVDQTVAALEEYKSNNGVIPYTSSSWSSFKNMYLQKVSTDYIFAWRDENQAHDYVPSLDTIAMELGHSCNVYGDGDNADDPIAGGDHDTAKVKYVIWTILESSSAKKLYCIDNRGK